MDMYLSMYEMGFVYPPPAETTFPPFLQHRYALMSRGPKPILDITNLLRPFSSLVWIVVCVTVVAGTVFVITIHMVYSTLPRRYELLKENVGPGRVAMQMVGSLTEPDKMHFFPAWSTGAA